MRSDCIEFAGSRQRSGHGQKWRDGKMHKAHRLAWSDQKGPIPEGLCVLHKCDNPPCVNIDHLFLGTQADNMADRDTKRRMRHKLSELQVSEIRTLLKTGATQAQIASTYGVDQSNISLIKNGRIW